MAYKQKKFTSISSGGWKPKVKVSGRSGEDFLLSCILLIVIFAWRGLWYLFYMIRSDQISRSVVSDSATPWIAAHQASLSITNSWSSLRLRSIESVMPSSHLILCRPLLLFPPIPPSIRVFSNESTLCMSFSFSIIPSKGIPGLISFRMDWLDLLLLLLLLSHFSHVRLCATP